MTKCHTDEGADEILIHQWKCKNGKAVFEMERKFIIKLNIQLLYYLVILFLVFKQMNLNFMFT